MQINYYIQFFWFSIAFFFYTYFPERLMHIAKSIGNWMYYIVDFLFCETLPSIDKVYLNKIYILLIYYSNKYIN